MLDTDATDRNVYSIEERKAKADKLIQLFATADFAGEAMLLSMYNKLKACQTQLQYLEEDTDAYPIMSGLVYSIRGSLGNVYSAALRSFLFCAPHRKEKALKAINERIKVLEHLIAQIRRYNKTTKKKKKKKKSDVSRHKQERS